MNNSDPLASHRSLFPICERYTFLNHAGTAPIGEHVRSAIAAFATRRASEPFEQLWPELQQTLQHFREQYARLINAARADEIVLLPSTSVAINTAAASLPLSSGDNVILLDGDYPANIYPWYNQAHHGVEVRLIPQHGGGIDLDVLFAHIDQRTRAVNLSSVMFASGFQNDIASVGRICAELGIALVVDATQSVGVLPVDVQAWHVAMLACSSHKWLLSEVGLSVFYCRHDLLKQLQPGAYVGTYSVVDPYNYLDYNFTLHQSADRFGLGNPNWQGLIALDTSLRLLLDIGLERISAQVRMLTDVLITDLLRRGYRIRSSLESAHRSGIVMVEVADVQAVQRRLIEHDIITAARGGALRIAPHFYNSEDDVVRVGTALDALGVQ